MLTAEDIKALARVTGLRPHQQEKLYVQHILLRTIYSEVYDELVFKGGTALMIFHGLNRFSEDLDFTLRKRFDLDRIEGRISSDMRLLGIPVILRKRANEKEGSYTLRVGVEGPLFTRDVERCHVRVEVSRREDIRLRPDVRAIESVYPDILPFTIPVMPVEEIAAEKIRALMTRTKARDLYDLWFLAKRGVRVDSQLVSSKLAFYDLDFDRGSLARKITGMNDLWQPELRAIVIGDLPDFKDVELAVSAIVR